MANSTLNFSFAGCGFLGIYHVGVASCIKQYAPHLTVGRISGASAGAIAAACLITDVCLGQCTSYVLRVATKARGRTLGPFHPSFNIMKILREGLEDILPNNAHELCNGHLHVSMTRVRDKKNVVVSQFDTKEDLIQALLCSAYIPLWSGLIPPSYKGVKYIDGAFSVNLPVLDQDTITVSPFAGESDICPTDLDSVNPLLINIGNTSVQLSTGNMYRATRILFPPHPEILSDMCRQGFDDCLKFLQTSDLISCTRHLSIRSSITTAKSRGELFSESDDSEYGEDHVDCIECKERLQVALSDTIPPMVQTALEASIKAFNAGLYNYIHQHNVYRVVSLMWAPLYLPLHIGYNFIKRFIAWMPYVPDDVLWVLQEIMQVLSEIMHHINKGRHRYSARFKCQLAISEISEEVDHHMVPAYMDTTTFTSKTRLKHKDVDFPTPYSMRHVTEQYLEGVHQIRNRLLEGDEVIQSMDVDDVSAHRSIHTSVHHPHEHAHDHGHTHNNNGQEELCHQLFDTFENCLQVANDREAVLAYYYMDEDDQVQVTEIFSLPENDSSVAIPPCGEMTWDSYGLVGCSENVADDPSMSSPYCDSIEDDEIFLDEDLMRQSHNTKEKVVFAVSSLGQ